MILPTEQSWGPGTLFHGDECVSEIQTLKSYSLRKKCLPAAGEQLSSSMRTCLVPSMRQSWQHSPSPRASVWKDTQQYKEGTNPLAIHFENKAEPKPVGSVTKAFRATKNVTLQTG